MFDSTHMCSSYVLHARSIPPMLCSFIAPVVVFRPVLDASVLFFEEETHALSVTFTLLGPPFHTVLPSVLFRPHCGHELLIDLDEFIFTLECVT